MFSTVKSILFVTMLSIVCSSLLTLAATGLKDYQLRNVAIDKKINILKSVRVVDDGYALTPVIIEKLYDENIRQAWINVDGKIITEQLKSEHDLPIYLYVKEHEILSYIIPVDSNGLWGRILGYLALKSDGKTISGFTVYSHSETPGLGGEIETSWFQNNFLGKEILDEKGNFVAVTIAKGSVEKRIPKHRQKNFVDGISGATMTGRFLSDGLTQALIEYEVFSKRFRNQEITTLKDF
ncbi:MAG: FMN-binding protein [Desulfobacterales bacterium]|nr:MAG: FMN-binding protein [Desulfobacterales bacterium]